MWEVYQLSRVPLNLQPLLHQKPAAHWATGRHGNIMAQ